MSLLHRLLSPRAKPVLSPYELVVGGQVLVVKFKRNQRAKRLIIRMNKNGQGVTVTLPVRASRDVAIDFVERSTGWVEQQLIKTPSPSSLLAGMNIPLRGLDHRLIIMSQLRGLVRLDTENRIISVPGGEAYAGRRLQEWLKKLAHAELSQASRQFAQAMNVTIGKITMRDQSSRWGSCSSAGDLSYNWRLILAPDYVLRYVAAHEVAHRLEMNHSQRFWRHVLAHDPAAPKAKDWLKRHGTQLHRYQFKSSTD